MLIYPPIPEIQLFKKMTHKIQGQGHGWSRSSKWQCESNIMNILSTHIPLVPSQMALPFLRYSIFKVWPWKSKVKVIAQGHKVGITPYLHTIPFVPSQSPVTFLGYNYLKIWHWKFKVKVISEVKVESHNVGPTLSRLTSILFYVNRASHSWVATISKFDLENLGSRSWVRPHFKVTMWV